MTSTPTASELIQRWEEQQAAYVAHREQRFDTMLRVLELLGHREPVVLDLASGAGSISARLVQRFPRATVVAVDKDPVLLQLARDTVGTSERVSVLEVDLADPGWATKLASSRFDAVLSSTALHWLSPAELAQTYLQLADLLPPGAVFLNADHLRYDPVSHNSLVGLARADDEATQAQAVERGVETWGAWWAAVEAVPAYAGLVQARRQTWEAKTRSRPATLGFHLSALRSAGFAEAATIWQHFDDYIVYGRR